MIVNRIFMKTTDASRTSPMPSLYGVGTILPLYRREIRCPWHTASFLVHASPSAICGIARPAIVCDELLNWNHRCGQRLDLTVPFPASKHGPQQPVWRQFVDLVLRSIYQQGALSHGVYRIYIVGYEHRDDAVRSHFGVQDVVARRFQICLYIYQIRPIVYANEKLPNKAVAQRPIGLCTCPKRYHVATAMTTWLLAYIEKMLQYEAPEIILPSVPCISIIIIQTSRPDPSVVSNQVAIFTDVLSLMSRTPGNS